MVKYINKLEDFDNLVSEYSKENAFVKDLGVTQTEFNSLEVFDTLGKKDYKKLYLFSKKEGCCKKGIWTAAAKLSGVTVIDLDSISDNRTKGELAEFIATELVSNNFDTKLYNTTKKLVSKTFYIYSTEDVSNNVVEGLVIGEAINNAKKLVMMPHSHLNAIQLAEYAKNMAKKYKIECTILDKQAIEKENMGLFLAVNQGSTIEPRLIVLKYMNNSDSNEVSTIVGKGLTFDTGGNSLKVSGSMVNMKTDMAGSATALGTIEAVARLGKKTNLMVVIPATDNKIGPDAFIVDDVVYASDGTSVEIHSTDAEGRLILADAILYAKKLGATKMIDIATLTGSCMMALGDLYTGVMTNNEEYAMSFISETKKHHEHAWLLPCDKNHKKLLASPVADMKNSSPNRGAGMSQAAAFLRHFVGEEIPWFHLDIAGTSYDSKTKSPTGVLVKSLVKFVSN